MNEPSATSSTPAAGLPPRPGSSREAPLTASRHATHHTAAVRRTGPEAAVLRMALLVAAVAAVGIVHVWSHTRVTAAGYRLGELQRTQDALRAQRNRLEVEIAMLRAPGRLEQFARTRLKMAPPAPGAVVTGGLVRAGKVASARARDGRGADPAEPLTMTADAR